MEIIGSKRIYDYLQQIVTMPIKKAAEMYKGEIDKPVIKFPVSCKHCDWLHDTWDLENATDEEMRLYNETFFYLHKSDYCGR